MNKTINKTKQNSDISNTVHLHMLVFLCVQCLRLDGNSVHVAANCITLSSKAFLKQQNIYIYIIRTKEYSRLSLQKTLPLNFLNESKNNNNSLRSPFVPEL
jgi:hypothetical protein